MTIYKLLKGYSYTLALFFMLLTTISLTSAEEIYVPVGQQGDATNVVERPTTGMTKDQVQERFGEPKDFTVAVGKPPISSWQYASFTVYFEHDRVIHSVLLHKN